MILQILEIIILFILPVLLVYYKIIPFKHRRTTLLIATVAILAIIIYERWSLTKLGIRTDNLVSSIIPYAIFTFIGIVSIYSIAKILNRKPQSGFYKNKRYILIILAGSVLQELLFRGFLFPKLQEIFNNYLIIILFNAVLFMLMHIVYSNTPVTLVTIFIAGLAFAGMYTIYSNLILISIAHIILNHVVVLYNFYREENISKKGRV